MPRDRTQRMLVRKRLFLVVVAAQALWSAACAAQATEITPEPTPVKVVMGENYFQPSTVRVKAGQPLRIEVVNEGQIAHALMVGRELERLTWEPGQRLQQDFFSGIELVHSEQSAFVGTARGTELTVYPRGAATLVLTVPEGKKGEWEIGCLIPGHYESGMRGTFAVE